MYLNKVTLIGNITKDLELKSTPGGTEVCSFSLATNRTYKDKSGAKQESVEFHNVVAWGKTAELICQYMRKGSQLYIEGRLETRNWDDKETGKKMYRTEIVVENMQFGNNKRDDDAPSRPYKARAGTDAHAEAQMDAVTGGNPNFDTIEYPADDVNPDEIPF